MDYENTIFFCCKEQPKLNNRSQAELADDSLKANLIGQWGGPGEDSPVWDIQKNSIYYFDRAVAYPYKILNGDMIIDLPGLKAKLRSIYVVKDTMYFFGEQGIKIKAYRFRSKHKEK